MHTSISPSTRSQFLVNNINAKEAAKICRPRKICTNEEHEFDEEHDKAASIGRFEDSDFQSVEQVSESLQES